MALELTHEQAKEALNAGAKLYEMAVHQRDTYRALLKAIVLEYGPELTLPTDATGYLFDEPDHALQTTVNEDGTVTVALKEVTDV